jgi:hypothetical protein
VPTLVLNGELDSLTTPTEGGIVASRFPSGVFVEVANSFHVVALDTYRTCAAEIVRYFYQHLEVGSTECAEQINPVRMVKQFPLVVAATEPATAGPGNQATTAELRIAAAAASTAGDVIARWFVTYGYGAGLRGGTFSYTDSDEPDFVLNNVRWVKDLAVNGTMSWTQDGQVVARLKVPGGTVNVSWNDKVGGGTATITGTIGGHAIVATVPAP